VSGLLALPIDLARYQSVLDAMSLPNSAVITIVDANGRVVASSLQPEAWIGKDISASAIVEQALAQAEGEAQVAGPDGVERVYGYAAIPQAGWHVFVGIPTEIIVADVRAATVRNGALSFLLIVFVSAVALLLGRHISQPIRALASATEAATRGQLDTRAPVAGPSEIADVAERFNALVAGRARVETALRDSEARFRQLAEHLPQMVWTAGPDGAIDYLSSRWLNYAGAPAEALLGEGWAAFVHPDDLERVVEIWRVALAAGRPGQAEFRIRRHDGAYRWFDTRVAPLRDDAGQIVQWVGSNTDAEQAHTLRQALRMTNRALRMLSDCNQMLIRTADEQALLTQICQTIVETGDYRLAWVGYAEHDAEHSVRPAAQFGFDHGYLESIQISWADTERGRGPTGTAIRSGKPVIARNLAHEPTFAPWRTAASARGYAASISLPLVVGGTTIGALNIYAVQPDAFDSTETTLLLELADDLSYGIATLRAREVHAQTQQELARSEERFTRIFRLSPSAVGITRLRDRVILDVNDAVCTLFDYTREELIGKPTNQLWHYDDEGEREAIARRLQEDGRVYNYEACLRTNAGKVVTVLFSIEQIELDDEACAIVIAHDISDRKLAEEAIQVSERRYAALIAQTWEAIALISPEGQILYASPTTPRMLDYTPDELMQLNVFDLVHPDDRAEAAERMGMALSLPGEIVQVTARLRNKAGEWRYLEATLTNLIDDPAVGAIVNNYRDVTDQRRLQEQFLQAQKMESVGRLAGGIAHDFNNLLTAIGGYADLTLEGLPEGSPPANDLEQIKNVVDRAVSLTRQLLTFARKQEIEPRVLNLNALVRDLEKLLRRLIGEDIELVIATAHDLHTIRADAGQIEQILVNLAVNARDAMPDGGVLMIETTNVLLDDDYVRQHLGAAPGEYVLLAVSDTGTGMSDEIQQHIFEPFFTTKAPGQGTGLGLATCYGIVQQHGGAISVYSELGYGTSFKICLPAITHPIQAPLHEIAAPTSLIGHETVLLVEDEPKVREIATRTLRGYGYTVIEAGSGEEALELIDQGSQPIDLLVTDVILPKMRGGNLAERVSAIYPALRILFISGYTDGTLVHRQEILARGAFLQKPFSPGALARKVREALDAAGTAAGKIERE